MLGSAARGTARGVDAALGSDAALAKTGTAVCSHPPRAPRMDSPSSCTRPRSLACCSWCASMASPARKAQRLPERCCAPSEAVSNDG